MFEAVAAAFGWVYGHLPSYGGSLLVLLAAYLLLVSRATAWQARSSLRLLWLQPVLEALPARYQDDAERSAAKRRLLRQHGVRRAAAVVPGLFNLAVLAVVFQVVTGFAAAGGPRYAEPGSALWIDLRASGGRMPWLTVDLAAAPATAAGLPAKLAPSLVGLLVLVGLQAMVRRGILAGLLWQPGWSNPRRGVFGYPLVVAAVFAAFVPAALLLCVLGMAAFQTAQTLRAARGMRRWARGAGWRRLEPFLIELLEADRAVPAVAGILRQAPAGVCSERFSWRARRLLLARLDGTVRLGYGLGGTVPPSHLEALAKVGLSAPEAYRLLGNLAWRGGRRSEAVARYRVAVGSGSVAARAPLAAGLGQEGHELLLAGDLAAARSRLEQAAELDGDPRHHLLAVVAELLDPAHPADRALERLEELRGELAGEPLVTFWLAILHLRQGSSARAVRALRAGGAGATGDSDGAWDGNDDNHMLLATLQGDDDTLAQGARRLFAEAGGGWLDTRPVAPWPMLAAVARRDHGLLIEILQQPERDRLPEWSRLIGAHVLLERAVHHAERGSLAEAEQAAGLAGQLLADRGAKGKGTQ